MNYTNTPTPIPSTKPTPNNPTPQPHRHPIFPHGPHQHHPRPNVPMFPCRGRGMGRGHFFHPRPPHMVPGHPPHPRFRFPHPPHRGVPGPWPRFPVGPHWNHHHHHGIRPGCPHPKQTPTPNAQTQKDEGYCNKNETPHKEEVGEEEYQYGEFDPYQYEGVTEGEKPMGDVNENYDGLCQCPECVAFQEKAWETMKKQQIPVHSEISNSAPSASVNSEMKEDKK